MTTLKRAVRSYSVAAKRKERALERNTREAAKQFRTQQLQQEMQSSEVAVSLIVINAVVIC